MILLRKEGRNRIKKRKKGSNLRERDGGSCIETRNSQTSRSRSSRSKREQDGKGDFEMGEREREKIVFLNIKFKHSRKKMIQNGKDMKVKSK